MGEKKQFCICCQSELSFAVAVQTVETSNTSQKKKDLVPTPNQILKHHLGLIICWVSCSQHSYFGTCPFEEGGGQHWYFGTCPFEEGGGMVLLVVFGFTVLFAD